MPESISDVQAVLRQMLSINTWPSLELKAGTKGNDTSRNGMTLKYGDPDVMDQHSLGVLRASESHKKDEKGLFSEVQEKPANPVISQFAHPASSFLTPEYTHMGGYVDRWTGNRKQEITVTLSPSLLRELDPESTHKVVCVPQKQRAIIYIYNSFIFNFLIFYETGPLYVVPAVQELIL